MKIFNLEYHNLTVQEALDRIFALLSSGKKADVFFMNADCLCIAQRDGEYREVLKGADLVLPDGIGVRIATKLSGGRMRGNCNGTDLSPRIIERASREHLKIFLLGGKEGVAQDAASRLSERFPGIDIAGCLSGYFQDDREVLEKINRARPDILFVAMGAPLQEKWIARNRRLLEARLCIGVGAFLDFASGRIRRAPSWMRAVGLEWLWRMCLEPRRLSKRYVNDMLCLAGLAFRKQKDQ